MGGDVVVPCGVTCAPGRTIVGEVATCVGIAATTRGREVLKLVERIFVERIQ